MDEQVGDRLVGLLAVGLEGLELDVERFIAVRGAETNEETQDEEEYGSREVVEMHGEAVGMVEERKRGLFMMFIC